MRFTARLRSFRHGVAGVGELDPRLSGGQRDHLAGRVRVVDDGVTGLLVPFEPATGGAEALLEPSDPARFARDFAVRVNELLADPERAERFGRAGRERVVEQFSWSAIAAETVELYARLLA